MAGVGGWDAAAWRLARYDRRWRAPVAALLLCEGAIDYAALQARVAQRRAGLPVLHSRMVESSDTGLPQRIDDDSPLTERLTFRHLPDAGADRIIAIADDLLGAVLDAPGDPDPWGMCTVVSGSSDSAVSGVITWFDHALVDAHGALMTFIGLTDEQSAGEGDRDHLRDAGPGQARPGDVMTSLGRLIAAVELITTRGDLLRQLRDEPVEATRRALAAVDHLRLLAGNRAAVSRPWPPATAGSARAVASVPLVEIRATVERLRSTSAEGRPLRLNDLLIAAVILAAWELSVEATTTVNVPMRIPADSATAGGNHLIAARLVVHPGAAGVPARRVAELAAAVGAQVQRWRDCALPGLGEWLGHASAAVPVGVLAQLVGGADLTVSNIRGPTSALHLLGRRIHSVHPLVPPLGSGISVALLTYAGQARLGCAVHTGVGVEPVALLARTADHLTGRAGA